MNVIEDTQVMDSKRIISGVDVETSLKTLKRKTKTYLVEKIAKRGIDIIGGIVGAIILIPLTLIIYIANKVAKDNGPIFFCQDRIGKDGKIFKMYKYRSMVVGADEKLKDYLKENPEATREYKIYKKLKNDPRITKVGKFIRKTSIDEFPQLINVLRGDMSLVGPRPYLPREKEDMGLYYRYIVSKKPGVTGLWQTSGRSDVTFDDRLNMDMKYYNTAGLKTDLKLLAKTAKKVIEKEGVA